ncbi:hypothetical protein Patl1_27793 [Pistacia atlantica]|uniref:Uncharacterized protein n=1 Tax=Pistacia atlantica TaxID=434234 RepID=A0ACC1BDR3_9ROSI|nr:hypothetical protein Patl1_27793 [Pistacia atlantica]
MLDNGNFVVYNESSDIIWSSFYYPTNTMLGGQNLYAGSELFSNVSKTNSSTGLFRLKMQEDGNLVLYPKNTIDKYTEASWASGTDGLGQLHVYLNYAGLDGVFRLYSHHFDSVYKTSILWAAPDSYNCPKGFCGFNSYCTVHDNQSICRCLPEVDKKILENMVKVGLWCVQDEPALRLSMKSVVMMLEGITDVSIPPCPTSS